MLKNGVFWAKNAEKCLKNRKKGCFSDLKKGPKNVKKVVPIQHFQPLPKENDGKNDLQKHQKITLFLCVFSSKKKDKKSKKIAKKQQYFDKKV